jgi:hypothetical protein
MIAALLLSCGLVALGSSARGEHGRSMLGVKILPSTGPRAMARNGHINFSLKVTGITLDVMHMGKAPIEGRGHIQFYLDRIPSDAYTRVDLQHNWIGFSATPIFTFNLAASPVRISPGHHRSIVALAKNNMVLYRAASDVISITVR